MVTMLTMPRATRTLTLPLQQRQSLRQGAALCPSRLRMLWTRMTGAPGRHAWPALLALSSMQVHDRVWIEEPCALAQRCPGEEDAAMEHARRLVSAHNPLLSRWLL